MAWINTLYQGDVLKTPWPIPDGSIQCCVTSPPYWGLRTYGTERWEGGDVECDHKPPQEWIDHNFNAKSAFGSGAKTQSAAAKVRWYNPDGSCPACGATRIDQQLGLEKTPELYIENMVKVFREVWRVLRKDGTVFLNMGDSYIASKTGTAGGNIGLGGGRRTQEEAAKRPDKKSPGLKPKDLCGIPWRLALALQADGWWLRSDIVWAKPNPMPESVTDRPTKSHEYIFLLTKSKNYFYDQDAVREPQADTPFTRERYKYQPSGWQKTGENPDTNWQKTDLHKHFGQGGRNLRSVWTFATKPYKKAHFATFPPELPRRCILAGTSAKGACPECGAPWARITESKKSFESGSGKSGNPISGKHPDGCQGGGDTGDVRKGPVLQVNTLGWRPTCSCGHKETVPCVVLDPFMGAGTTAEVAIDLDRDFFGVDLNGDYLRDFAQPRVDRVLKRQKARQAQGVFDFNLTKSVET